MNHPFQSLGFGTDELNEILRQIQDTTLPLAEEVVGEDFVSLNDKFHKEHNTVGFNCVDCGLTFRQYVVDQSKCLPFAEEIEDLPTIPTPRTGLEATVVEMKG